MANTSNANVANQVFATAKEIVEASYEGMGCIFAYAPTEEAALPCLAVLPINGEPISKQYLDGSRTESYRFAFVLRVKEETDQGRISACEKLSSIVGEMESSSMDFGAGRQFWGCMRESNPFCETNETGYIDWRVTLVVSCKTAA